MIFEIGSLSAPKGGAAAGYVETLELSDGTRVPLPVHLINGARPGPTVFVGGGMHGDEINGIRAVMDVVSKIEPTKLAGRIIAIPVQNPIAFRNRYRLLTLNQLDERNTHRAFPGNPYGDTSSRLCNFIYNDVIRANKCDFVVDCHTGSTGSYYPPLVFVSTIGPTSAVEASLKAAQVFNAPTIIRAGKKAGVYAMGRMLHMVAVENGIPAIGCELGTALPAEKHHSDVGCQGILNILSHLGMIQTDTGSRVAQVFLDEIVEVRAERGGLCDYLVAPGSSVRAGQPIAQIMNVFGEAISQIESPIDGRIVTCTYWGSINQGERIVRIGRTA